MAYHKKTHRNRGKASKKHHKTQRSKRGGVGEELYDVEAGPSNEDLMEQGRSISPPPQQPVATPQLKNKSLDINSLSNAMELGQAGQNGGKRRTKKRSAKRRNKSRKMPKVCLMCKKKCKSCKCSNCGCPTCRVRSCKCRKSMIKRLLGM